MAGVGKVVGRRRGSSGFLPEPFWDGVTFFPAWIFALLAWSALGRLFSRGRARLNPPEPHSRLVAQNQIDLSVPLRWRGRLREDPMALPWGHRYEIDLEQVEAAGVIVPVSGGLRLNFYSGTHAADPPADLRAGYRMEALAKAKPPRNFLDPGAIDIRGMLARQGVDLLGSLRSGELLQVDRPAAADDFAAAGASAGKFAGAARCPVRGSAGEGRDICGRCCWATAALWTPRWCRRFRRPPLITCW